MKEVLKILYNNLKNETVVVATSGGPDSMTLLYLVNKIKQKQHLKVVCAHVNHKLRPESTQEEQMIKQYCKKHGIFFEKMTINAYNKDNFHNDARKKRYDFFDKTVKKCQAKHLLTAHHGDDLIETVLMRIVRGSTLKGYAGFQEKIEKNSYTILRPLIKCTKEEILNFAKKHNIPYAIDSSNKKDKYTRNRFRKYIIPELKKENKNLHQKIYQFSKTLQMYDNYVNTQTKKHLNLIHENTLNIDKLKNLDNLTQTKIVHEFLKQIYKKNLNQITKKHTELILKIIQSQKPNQTLNLPKNITIIKSYNKLYIKKTKTNNTYKIKLEKITKLPNGKIIEIKKTKTNNSNNITCLNTKELKLPLYIRTKKPGDIIEVKGLNGHKKIKDIFIDEKIPKYQREKFPILVDSNNTVIWLPGLKKSKFDKQKNQNYDIILEYI